MRTVSGGNNVGVDDREVMLPKRDGASSRRCQGAPNTAKPSSPGGPEPGVILVWTDSDLEGMCREIGSRGRDYPVVGLTSRQGEDHPALSAAGVREIVGPGVPIYFIPTGPLTHTLQGMLPDGLHVFGGAARVWWPYAPGDPLSHPLVLDPGGVYGEESLKELARQFNVNPRLRIVLLERQRTQAEGRSRRLGEQLRTVSCERDEALVHAQAAESTLRRLKAAGEKDAEPQGSEPEAPGDSGARVKDFEEELHKLIFEEWLRALSDSDRAEYPLGRYIFSSEFVGQVERHANVSRDRLAWVCAMVACGKASRSPGLQPHALRRGGGGGSDPQRKRADGARALRCNLKNAAGGPRLHYWIQPNGTVEFASLASHDDYSIPQS
jgi:hypothetical protein